MVRINRWKRENRAGKKGKKHAGRVCGGKHRNGQAAKKRTVILHHQQRMPGPDISDTSRRSGTLSGQARYRILDFPAASHADMLLHLWDSVRKYQESRSHWDIRRVRDRELVAHAITSERELCDGFFDICNPASQVRFYVRILDISILAFMASFAVWISLALGKNLNCLRYQPHEVAAIRFDFKFHAIHTPSAQADNSPKPCLFKPVKQQKKISTLDTRRLPFHANDLERIENQIQCLNLLA